MEPVICIKRTGSDLVIATGHCAPMEVINMLLSAIQTVVRDSDYVDCERVAAMLRGCAFLMEM